MQTPTPQLPPENEEIAAELRYLESIDDKTTTVRQYAHEDRGGRALYIETWCGPQLVTGIQHFSDGPWIVTGKGFGQSSYAVCWDTKLRVEQAS